MVCAQALRVHVSRADDWHADCNGSYLLGNKPGNKVPCDCACSHPKLARRQVDLENASVRMFARHSAADG